MKIYSKQNVFEVALERIRYLFEEFDNKVVVNFSGGKDSTVIYQLAKIVARERKCLPLKAMFIDQEAEWSDTIKQIKTLKDDKDTDLYWYQMELKMLNATSLENQRLKCWNEKEKKDWLRDKESDSIHVNKYGTDRFAALYTPIYKKDFPGHIGLAGVRTEESPSRFMGLTEVSCYKHITWGRKSALYTFYPIYDWSYTDIWKAIHDNDWPYNKVYDYQYRYGVPIQNMRVSNLHHETAVHSLFYLQEVDPELYEKLTKRISGIDMAGKLGRDNFFVKKLPFVFKDWLEYRDYLLNKLIKDKKWKTTLELYADKWDNIFKNDRTRKEAYAKVLIQSIVANDVEITKIKNANIVAQRYKRDQIIKEGNEANWRTAKDKSHEYILQEDYPDVFKRFERMIKRDGKDQVFTCYGHSKVYRYLFQPEYKYWIVENVLNRTNL